MAFFRTIRSKILVGVVTLLVIVALALTVAATQRTEAALREQIEATHEAQAERIAGDLDRRLVEAIRFAETTASHPAFDGPVAEDELGPDGRAGPANATEQRTVLNQVLKRASLFSAAWLVDSRGQMVLGVPFNAQQQMEHAIEDDEVRLEVFVQIADQARVPFFERGLSPGSWLVVAPLTTPDGMLHGILVFDGQSAPLVGFVETAIDRPGTVLLVLDDEGRVIAGPPAFAAGYDAATATRTLGVGSGQAEEIELDGKEYLASSFDVASSSWRLVLATETDEAFAAVDTIIRSTILIGGLALVFGIAMSLVLAQDISIPLNRLKDAAERVTAGEYGTQVRVATGDELSDLAGAFNAMSARLREENQNLLGYQESLEETVAERTQAFREKNEELEAFVYAASHDLRTPIISLDWLLQELEDGLKDRSDADVHETIARIRANIDGMDRLVADLLELSRIGRTEGEPGPVGVQDAVQEVVEGLQAAIQEHDAEIRVDVPSDAVVLADQRRVHQVFSNLIGNALKHGRSPGGTIKIRATPIGRTERPWKWRIEVQDDGPGIPAEHRERIFMLFQRAPDPLGRPIEGTGVGLALVRKIVNAHGGQVHVTEAPGGGALFWFTLPAPRGAGRNEQSGRSEDPGDDPGAPAADAPAASG